MNFIILPVIYIVQLQYVHNKQGSLCSKSNSFEIQFIPGNLKYVICMEKFFPVFYKIKIIFAQRT